jgi:formiminotetrahydrofolate cyclodeaminase
VRIVTGTRAAADPPAADPPAADPLAAGPPPASGRRPPGASRSLGDHTLEEYLAAVAARRPAPSGGAVAAVTVASAAGLVAMAARFSAGLAGADAVAAEADELRVAVLALADADPAAYGDVLAAHRIPRADGSRADRIRAALTRAAEVPLEIAAAGARVAAAGVGVAEGGNPNLAGDAVAAVLLAEAATRAAGQLVLINVELGGLDPALAARARELTESAGRSGRALALIADKAIIDPEM